MELEETKLDFAERGLNIAALTYDSVAILRHFGDRKEITYPLLSDPDSEVIRAFGILIASEAGSWDDEHTKRMFDINVFGAARVTASAVQHMQDGGAIVNVSSISCRLNDQGDLALYGATKAALESLTRSNAHQLGPRGIRVNAIAPGIIDVAMSDDMRKVAFSEKTPLKRCPLGRMGTAEEIAECVEFLLSDRASYVNGTTLIADGGISGY